MWVSGNEDFTEVGLIKYIRNKENRSAKYKGELQYIIDVAG